MNALRTTFHAILLLVSAAGHSPLWLHQASGCCVAVQSESCDATCDHIDLSVPLREQHLDGEGKGSEAQRRESNVPVSDDRLISNGDRGRANATSNPHDDCFVCGQLSELSAPSESPALVSVAANGQQISAVSANRESSFDGPCVARGPPAR